MVLLNGPHIIEITGRCLELILSGYTEIAYVNTSMKHLYLIVSN